jgi:beta-lactamase regulating signal transducer with metallopeptidase domain
MLELFLPGRSLAWDLAWQATAFLVVGGLASLLLRARPSRAHRVLLLAMMAGLLTPLLGQAVRRLGLGLLASRATARAAATPEPGPRPFGAPAGRGPLLSLRRPAGLPVRGAEITPGEGSPVANPSDLRPRIAPAALVLGGWGVLTLASAVRLAVSLVLGLRVARRATRLDDPALLAAAAAARARLGLDVRVQPEVFASARIRCPVVWCWGPRPKLIVPEGAAGGDPGVDWVAVLSHELAHWSRRDHLAALAGEVFTCILPWHLLAWWAKGRMAQLAELACDDWVLASGQGAADYAATLLDLAPQGRAPLVPAAVSTRGGLVGRIHRILADVRHEPRAGRRWTALAVTATMLAAAATALVQSRPSAVAAVQAEPPRARAAAADLPEHVVSGRILLPDGKPAAGAAVDWFTFDSASDELHFVALPKHMRDKNQRLRMLGQATADADGRFRIVTGEDLGETLASELVASAPGVALRGHTLWTKDIGKEITLTLAPAVTIEGRLLTPSGTPASGVTVELADFHNGADDELKYEGVNFEHRSGNSERPRFAPRPMTTDADGRFVLEGVVPRGMFAEFHFRHPDYADDEVTVSTAGLLTNMLRAFDIRPVRPKFTHSLEPARPVEGLVTAKGDGTPIAGALVEVIPMRRHGGQSVYTTTDAEGRYRVASHQADNFFVSVYPPPGSDFIAAQRNHQGWPEGARALTMDFTLTRGKRFRGTVIDAETRRPIAGASVVYQPKRRNPNHRDGQEFRNPVLTDAAGRFAIAGLPGEGYLLVEEASLEYIRGTLSGKETGVFGTMLYPHGFAHVDAATDTEPAPVEIALRKGQTLEARAIGPDGQSVPWVLAGCPELSYRQLENWSALHWFDGGLFKLKGAAPGRTYRVFFYQKELKLAAVAKLTLDPKRSGPIEVKLQPMATVKGVAVNKEGTPALGVQIYPLIVLTEDEAPLKDNDFYDHDKADFYSNMTQDVLSTPTTPAEFAFTNLIPGVRYYVAIARRGGTYHEVRAPKPGEVIDLGKIVVEDKR